MKFAIVLFALFAVALARPNEVKPVTVDRDELDVGPESHKFGYHTSDGTAHDSEGHLKDAGTDHEAYVIQGQYSYFDTAGKEHTIKYIANELGFQATGEDIPVGPQ